MRGDGIGKEKRKISLWESKFFQVKEDQKYTN